MTMNAVVDQLRYGELKSVAVKDDTAAIYSYVNLALNVLYNKFDIQTNISKITMVAGQYDYIFSTSMSVIHRVYDSEGIELELDNISNPNSVTLTGYRNLVVPNPEEVITLFIVHSVNAPYLVYDIDTIATTELPLPLALLEPLYHYVGYRAHASMNGDIKAENNTHYMRFERSCKAIIDKGLIRRDVISAEVSLQALADRATDISLDYATYKAKTLEEV